SGILNIQSRTNIVHIEIYNQLGQLVFSNTGTKTIDISSLEQGIYFVKIMDEYGNVSSKKVVKR
ncbi:MAG: T9SS type A sorting domain-containing protein, partial [Acidimicrobiia bacterium]|nr:T9SS type A sorting domain-containing protein [Acidimicrobiia bacterium]